MKTTTRSTTSAPLARLLRKKLQLLPTIGLLCLLLSLIGNAQTPVQMSHNMDMKGSETQKFFEKMKSLAGSWKGTVTNTPKVPQMDGKDVSVDLRVSSSGNALIHLLSMNGLPDNPLTVFYTEADRLMLTHYCDAGNRPRMGGKISADGKTLEYDFLDLSGGNKTGHMHRTAFTIIDADHHIEEWTFMLPGDVPMRARFDLRRVK